MTTVPCCPRIRPHTNSSYYFSRDEATLSLLSICNAFGTVLFFGRLGATLGHSLEIEIEISEWMQLATEH